MTAVAVREPMRRRAVPPRTVLAVSAFGVFMAFVDATIVNVAFPDIQRSFPTASIAALSWVLNAYNIVFAAFLVAAGRFADLLGRRRTFEAGLVLFTFSSVLCAVAPTLELLVAARVVQALGAAVVVPASLALVLEAFPAGDRRHAVALWTAVAALAAGVGPSLGGLLVSLGDWRLAFLVNVPIGVVAVALARSRLVESRAPGRRRLPDVPGALLLALALGGLSLAIAKGNDWGWASPVTLATFAMAILLGGVFAWRCSWHPVPLFDVELLRNRAFSVANGLTVMGAAGFFAYTLCNVLFLTAVWRYSVLEAGLALTPGPFVAAAVAGPGSRLAARLGARAVIAPGAVLWGLAVLYLVEFVGPEPDFLGEWLPGMIALGVGAGLAFPNLSAAAVDAAPGNRFATATSLNSVTRQLGAVLGVAILVAIVGSPAPGELAAAFDAGWTFAAACLLAAGIGALALGRPARPDATHAVEAPAEPRAAIPPVAPARRADAPAGGPPAADGHAEKPADLLAHSPIFARLAPDIRAGIAARAAEVELPAGDWLFRQGDAGDSLYVVRVGRLEVLREDDGLGGVPVRIIGRGEVVGELALVTGDARAASVRARRDSVLMRIEREHFATLLERSPEVAVAMTRVLGEQLKESRPVASTTRPVAATVAVVPLDAGVPARLLADGLVAALGPYGRVAHVEAPDRAEAPATYAPLIDRAERAHDRVVLAGGLPVGDDAWTRACLSHADRILAVTSGGPVPDWARGNVALTGCDLVGWDVPVGSGALADWVEALAPAQAHALRPGPALEDGIARLARRLAGRSVGVVLSGGGARAFAHLGVLEELFAAGITVDRVSGVSMGAFVGGMLALGMDVDEMDARCYEEWMRRSPLADYTFPRASLIRGDRMRAMLQRTFGEASIEELDLGFVCTSADLRSGTAVRHRFGPLWEQVGTSMCLPVLAAPQRRGKRLLVDGCMIDNLPVHALAADNEGPIVAVDVKAGFARPQADGTARRRNGRGRQAAAGEPPPPSIPETLMRVLLLASANAAGAATRAADLVITVRSDGIGLLEFHQLDAAREAGRRAAQEALASRETLLGGSRL